MNAFAHFPARLHWTAQELADAVPLRLHEMFAYDAAASDHARRAANAERRRARVDSYLPPAALRSHFRVG